VLIVDPDREGRLPATLTGPGTAVLDLDGPGSQIVSVAADALSLRRALESATAIAFAG
jgi:hypothetical protein